MDPGAAARATASRGRRALARGEHAKALPAFDEATRVTPPAAAGTGLRLWGADHVEAAAGAGEGRRAAGLLRDLMRLAAHEDAPELDALVNRAAGVVAREDDMDLLFQEALAIHDELVPGRLDRARTLLLYGERLARAGRPDEAAARLTEALRTLDGPGAEAWKNRCRRALESLED